MRSWQRSYRATHGAPHLQLRAMIHAFELDLLEDPSPGKGWADRAEALVRLHEDAFNSIVSPDDMGFVAKGLIQMRRVSFQRYTYE